jgi:hypothetical protein
MEIREPAKSFKELIVWQKAHQLKDVDEVGRLLESYMQGIKRNTNS